MALSEGFEVPTSHLTAILAWEGPPYQKLKYVLKSFLDNFRSFKYMAFVFRMNVAFVQKNFRPLLNKEGDFM